MNPNTTTEYRNLPLAVLTESTTNPRRIFEDAALKELAESIHANGIIPFAHREGLSWLAPVRVLLLWWLLLRGFRARRG